MNDEVLSYYFEALERSQEASRFFVHAQPFRLSISCVNAEGPKSSF